MRSPFAAESLSDPGGLVVLTSPDSATPDPSVDEALSSLPCLVVAVGRGAGDAPSLADVAPEEGVASVDDIVAVAERNPVAATALALCLRQASPSLGRALVAESAAYSVLQAGAEFQELAGPPSPSPAPGPNRVRPVKVIRRGDRLELVLNRPHVRNALSRALPRRLSSRAWHSPQPTIP